VDTSVLENNMKFLLLLLIIGSDPLIEYQQKLKELEKKLFSTREKLKDLKKEEKSLKTQIKYLEKEEKILESIIDLLNERERNLLEDMREIEAGSRKADSIIESSLERLREGLIFLYKRKKPNLFQKWFETGSLYRGYQGVKSVKRALLIEEKFYKNVLNAKRKLENYKEKRKRDLIELASLREEMAKRERDLKKTREKKKKLLSKVKREKISKKKYLQELETSIKKLERLIAKILEERERERKRRGIKKGTIAGRKLIWPLKGSVVSKFGTLWHPKYKTKIKNNGIDIRGTPGSPIVAVESGEVVFADPFLGYGNLIIIDHNGFFSVYGQVGEVAVEKGDKVLKGSVIGIVGNEEPVIHFELRVGGEAVDPLKYLP
jgi:septal ring factor EnvC (AmiA/AmiB activator)